MECVPVSRHRISIVACAAWGLLTASPLWADEIDLENGLTLEGTIVPIDGFTSRLRSQNSNVEIFKPPFWMIDDGVRRYFVARRVADDPRPEDIFSRVTFELSHERSGRGLVPHQIGSFAEVTEFDEYGRRRVTLKTQGGRLEHILEGITEITPRRALVESTSHDWKHGLDLTAIPADKLDAMIRHVIDPDNPDDRKGVVEFYIRAKMYRQAREELEAIADEFPELAAWAEEARLRVAYVNALRALNEIRNRQSAGQHQLAYRVASAFDADHVSADLLHDAQDIVADYDRMAQDADRARMLLGLLQADVPDETVEKLGPMRAAVIEELHPDNIDRLSPFLRAEADNTLSAEEKLALAYSGWILGAGNAVTDLSDALALWEMRFLATEYLRTDGDPTRRADLMARLRGTEGASVERLTQMAPLLPLPIETEPLVSGAIHPIEVQDSWGITQHRYSVVLPPEYSSQHTYPLLVVLRPEGRTDEQELMWWAGREGEPGAAQRRGYITIAPDYAGQEQGTYEYNNEVHQTVLESISDARKRFRIDSDRIYLAGHGMGADACFDLGMSHPGVFAGVIPIAGATRRYCMFYRRNAPDLAWYVVSGERDPDSLVNLEEYATDLNDMMKQGQDVLYCEYKARGFESYYEELPRIFEWMQLHTRQPWAADWEVRILRHTDTRFYWMQVGGLPASMAEPIVWDPPRHRRLPVTIKGKISPGNSVIVQHNAASTTLWLTPDLVDFDERLRVRVNGRTEFNDFLAPDAAALLEGLRVSGDRERLVWARLEF